MPTDPFVREKFTKERTAARKLAAEYLQRFPKDRYQTEVESWRELQSQNIEFTMKRLREPIEGGGERAGGLIGSCRLRRKENPACQDAACGDKFCQYNMRAPSRAPIKIVSPAGNKNQGRGRIVAARHIK